MFILYQDVYLLETYYGFPELQILRLHILLSAALLGHNGRTGNWTQAQCC
jgi:hypothetical protein